MPWEDIEERLNIGKEKGIKSASLFDKLLIKKGLMKMNLPSNGSQRSVTIDFRKSLTEIANEYYEKAKKSEKKETTL